MCRLAKTFTAALILDLQAEGRLRLDGLHFMIGFARQAGAVSRIHVATALSETWGRR